MKTFPALCFGLLISCAYAQEPAVDTSKPAVDTSGPAVDTSSRMPAPPSTNSGGGTTIVGERESPIGLYIMPWRNSGPEQGIDRPARLLQEEALPIDPGTFRRQLDYYTALTAHKQAAGTTP